MRIKAVNFLKSLNLKERGNHLWGESDFLSDGSVSFDPNPSANLASVEREVNLHAVFIFVDNKSCRDFSTAFLIHTQQIKIQKQIHKILCRKAFLI